MSSTPPSSSQIFITLSDQSGLLPSVATVYVAGWINGGSGSFQILGADGCFSDPTAQSFTIQATRPWQNTGITVTQGTTVTLTVTYGSGDWTADPHTNGGNLYDANGCPGVIVPADRTAFPIVGVPMGALVGRVGGGTPFLIGDGPQIVSTETGGALELCINDDLTGAYGAGLTDNSGSITVQIAQGLPFFAVSSIPQITLATTTNGNERLIFVASPSQPLQLPIANQVPMQYTAYPYANQPPPALMPPGPFDIFEFGFNAAADVSAVNGFGLNLSFSYGGASYGVDSSVSRDQIGKAFAAFISTEMAKLPAAEAFEELLYDGAIAPSAPTPPAVAGQFFALCDPNDMLQARQIEANGQPVSDALATYWDATLAAFFAVGNYLSVNVGTDIYSGQSTSQPDFTSGQSVPCYTLTNSSGTSYDFYQPPAGIAGALYVFQQAFGALTPAGGSGDAGLLQDNIWEALCRGVALDGVFTTPVTSGQSTTAWNNSANWYQSGTICDFYAKFLHYGTVDGTQIFYDGAAYGFSLDENPDGPYTGPNVPSKTIGNVPGGSTISVVIGPWTSGS